MINHVKKMGEHQARGNQKANGCVGNSVGDLAGTAKSDDNK